MEKSLAISNKPNKLIILDFDETLFDTSKFKEDLKIYFKNKFDLDFYAKYESFKNKAGAYDYISHIKSSGTNLSREEIYKDFQNYFKEQDYEYPDVKEFLNKTSDSDHMIVTLGFDNFQKSKISLNENLKTLRVKSLLQDKPSFIKNNIEKSGETFKFLENNKEYDEIIFIDDRPKFLLKEKIEGLKQYRIRREGSKYYEDETPETAIEIKLLTDILK